MRIFYFFALLLLCSCNIEPNSEWNYPIFDINSFSSSPTSNSIEFALVNTEDYPGAHYKLQVILWNESLYSDNEVNFIDLDEGIEGYNVKVEIGNMHPVRDYGIRMLVESQEVTLATDYITVKPEYANKMAWSEESEYFPMFIDDKHFFYETPAAFYYFSKPSTKNFIKINKANFSIEEISSISLSHIRNILGHSNGKLISYKGNQGEITLSEIDENDELKEIRILENPLEDVQVLHSYSDGEVIYFNQNQKLFSINPYANTQQLEIGEFPFSTGSPFNSTQLGSLVYILVERSIWQFNLDDLSFTFLTDFPGSGNNSFWFSSEPGILLVGAGATTNPSDSSRPAEAEVGDFWEYNIEDDEWTFIGYFSKPTSAMHSNVIFRNNVHFYVSCENFPEAQLTIFDLSKMKPFR